MKPDLPRRAVSEAMGTAVLLAAVVGSGIMAERLAAGNTAVALLCNTIATGATLTVLILIFGPLSGAHFNPVVSIRVPTRIAVVRCSDLRACAVRGRKIGRASCRERV